MAGQLPPPRPPGERDRLAARERPAAAPVMYQQWRELLFLHWEYPPEELQRTLPDGLFLDTFGGRAFLGIVPFFMRNIRPRFLPAVPGVSNFLELNLRTYVLDRAGVPGVWFYSLDANRRLAVAVARRWFHLPYVFARMTASVAAGGTVRYQSVRPSEKPDSPGCRFEYAPAGPLPQPTPGSLEFFLIERYRLYAAGGGRLWRGAVSHQPYPLCAARVTTWNDHLLSLNGFVSTGRAPDHVALSRGVDVEVFAVERV
jgi:hypothetical protein